MPQAQYKWLKDGEPLSDFKDAVVYKIFNAARNDSGSYQCLAHNVAGTIFSEKSEVIVACKYKHTKDSSGGETILKEKAVFLLCLLFSKI